jgi:hypothetical protein
LDKTEVTLGEPFTLTIRVTHPALDIYTLPEPITLDPLTLHGAPSVTRTQKGETAETAFTLPLVDLRSLDPQVPALVLRADGPGGARTVDVPAQKLKLRSLVAEERAGSPERAHHGPKPPVPVIVRSWLWAWSLGLLLATAATILAVREVRRRRAMRPVPAPEPPSPEDEAMARLLTLKQRKPWDRGLGRAAVFELSEILRGYLGRRLRFDALDLTSDELLTELHRRRILGLDLTELSGELSWQDLVKFARAEPTGQECERAIDRAASLVDRTRAVVGLGPPAPAVEARS